MEEGLRTVPGLESKWKFQGKSKSFRSKIGKRNARDLEIYPLPSFLSSRKDSTKVVRPQPDGTSSLVVHHSNKTSAPAISFSNGFLLIASFGFFAVFGIAFRCGNLTMRRKLFGLAQQYLRSTSYAYTY